jgi:hypothetical protein
VCCTAALCRPANFSCKANGKVYLQRKPVNYADYRIGMYYISSFDLRDEDGIAVIAPLENKPVRKPLFDFLSMKEDE